jgi:taurine dioxygenase
MSEEESRGLLEHLFSLAKRAELQCRVRWEPETLVVWDNR